MSKKKFTRDLSFNEKLYKIIEENYKSLAIQIIIEGFGKINSNDFYNAVKKANDACPLSKCIYRNNKWVESKKNTPIYYLNSFEFDGFDFSSDLFKKKINHSKNPVTEIFFVKSNPNRIIFRVFHGAMDAKGALIWIKNIFRALNKKALIKCTSTENDLTILSKLPVKNKSSKLILDKKITNKKYNYNKANSNKINIKRISLEGRYNGIISKISKVLTDLFDDYNSRYLIPSDLRKYNKYIISNANLTLPIYLECDKSESWQEINNKFLYKLKNNNELNIRPLNFKLLNKLPIKTLNLLIKTLIFKQKLKNKYMISSIISHLGKLNLTDFDTNSFNALNIYSIPVSQPFSPISFVIVENQKNTEIIISAYENKVPKTLLNQISTTIKEFLSEQYIYKQLNNTQFNIKENLSIVDMFKLTALKFKKNIAVSENDVYLTYEELDYKSDTLAKIFMQKGINKSSLVPVYFDRSINLIIVILAIFKIGAIYIPIDISTKNFRINQILNDDSIKFIVSNKNLINKLSDIKDKKIIVIDLINLDTKINLDDINIDENDTIYQIYTSGSTGIPKGVQITNRAFKNYLLWARNYYAINENNNFPLFSSISVDFTLTSIFLPLTNGGQIYIFKEFNSITLKSMLSNFNINSLKFTPTHLSIITSLDIDFIIEKRLLIIGGEQLDIKLASLIQNMFVNCKIVNEYGPTESTVGCIAHTFDISNDSKYNCVPIGKPIFNTKIFLLDKNLKFVKPHQIGEIYILGNSLSKGYYNNDNLNKTNFVFINGKKAYKTGDLAKLNNENNYIFLGRVDDQVKIAGNRVELEEIKYTIKQYNNIKEVILIYDKTSSDIILKCYFTSDKNINISKLKSFLRIQLANYMVPKFFIQINKIPISPSGKIDLKQLPIIDFNTNHLKKLNKNQNKYLTNTQKKLLSIWSLTLDINISQINLYDNFFDLGGDSLSLINMIDYIESDFSNSFDYTDFIKNLNIIYEDLTIINLAKILS